ncbi:flagellin, partial [uncultured Reyranella sp.]
KQLQSMTSAAADLGSVKMRIELQENFVNKLTDSLDKGVGRLVDAEMNEESTRLKALQTQQQLAVQALSIANNDSQSILSLFR